MNISAIVAIGNNREIGKNNDMPWHVPADSNFFKRKTLGHPIIMGRKNFESLKEPFPNRTKIIITRNPSYSVSNAYVTNNLTDALKIAHEHEEEEIFIIGGAGIYDLSKDIWTKMYITEIDIEVPDADVFFPELDMTQWKLTDEDFHKKDEKNDHDFVIKTYERV